MSYASPTVNDSLDPIKWGSSAVADDDTTLGTNRLDLRLPPDNYHVFGEQVTRFRQLLGAMSSHFLSGYRLKLITTNSNPFSSSETGLYATTAGLLQLVHSGTTTTIPSFSGTAAKGSLIAGLASGWGLRAVGANGLALVADSGQTTGLTWAAPKASESDNYTWTGTHAFNGATVTIGDASTDTLTVTSSIASNLTFTKESAHTISIAASTTAATAGGALTITSANGNGAAGGAVTIDTGGGTAGGALTIGGTNAASLSIGRAGVTTSVLGTLAAAAIDRTAAAPISIGGTATAADLNANVNLTCSAGTTAVDLSLGQGAFKTTTGTFTHNGKQAAGATTNDIADPGAGGAIPVTTSGVCNVTTAAAEGRTVADPTFSGQWLTISHDVDAGDLTVTFASDFDSSTNNVWTSDTAGKSGHWQARRIANALKWMLVANNGGVLS